MISLCTLFTVDKVLLNSFNKVVSPSKLLSNQARSSSMLAKEVSAVAIKLFA